MERLLSDTEYCVWRFLHSTERNTNANNVSLLKGIRNKFMMLNWVEKLHILLVKFTSYPFFLVICAYKVYKTFYTDANRKWCFVGPQIGKLVETEKHLSFYTSIFWHLLKKNILCMLGQFTLKMPFFNCWFRSIIKHYF